MNSILKKDVKSSFEKEWLTTYVPAIILYGQKSRKKGDYVDQKYESIR